MPATPGGQNIILYPYVNPPTELIDATNLPNGDVNVDADLSSATDGTQIWKITHNGVDTHPIHFHLFDVQVLNRVTWDNIIIPPDADRARAGRTPCGSARSRTRSSPCARSSPTLPFEVPNSDPAAQPDDAGRRTTSTFNEHVDPHGNPLTTPITNQLVNFGWEYVCHCHILSHEEMDMMRPVSLALPPIKPDGLASTFVNVLDKNGKVVGQNVKLTWNDNSITETRFVVKRTTDGTTWTTVTTVPQPLGNGEHTRRPDLHRHHVQRNDGVQVPGRRRERRRLRLGHAVHDGVVHHGSPRRQRTNGSDRAGGDARRHRRGPAGEPHLAGHRHHRGAVHRPAVH